MTAPTVVLAGALDTKGEEYALARDLVLSHGLRPLLVDVGVLGEPTITPDITRNAVCAAAGLTLEAVREGAERSESLESMAAGLRVIVLDLQRRGDLGAVLAMGGSGALAVAAPAFRALPLGVPKVIVSTMASADMTTVIGASDLLVMPSIVDLAGVNRVSRLVVERAVATVSALIGVPAELGGEMPTIALSMLGVTTAGVTEAAQRLGAAGCEPLTFHANGQGGRTLEALAEAGWLDAVVDLTTGEIAGELLGGTSAAGPDRLTAAGARAIPQVVSVGGCDLVIYGGPDQVPDRYRERTLYQHGPTATLMRTSVEECREIGAIIAAKLASARGPVAVLLPTGGLSALSERGGPFHDEAADAALLEALRDGLPDSIDCVTHDAPLNSPAFGELAAERAITALK